MIRIQSPFYHRLRVLAVDPRPSVPLMRRVPAALTPGRPVTLPRSRISAPEMRSPIDGLRRWWAVVAVDAAGRGRIRREKSEGLRVRVVATGAVRCCLCILIAVGFLVFVFGGNGLADVCLVGGCEKESAHPYILYISPMPLLFPIMI